ELRGARRQPALQATLSPAHLLNRSQIVRCEIGLRDEAGDGLGAGFYEIRLRVLLRLDGLVQRGVEVKSGEARDFLQQLGRMQRLREQAEADASFACLQQQVIGCGGEEEDVACGQDLFRLY